MFYNSSMSKIIERSNPKLVVEMPWIVVEVA